jgi:ADP-heptose:LPS heptosyltransferase
MSPAPLDWLVSGACYAASVPFRLLNQSDQLVPPEQLLILKPCCIGDVLLATPVAAALQRAFPGIRIDWAVGPWSRPMVATNPRLGKIVNAEEIGAGRAGWPMVRRVARRIRAEHYDTCLVLDRSPVLAMIPWLAGIPQRIGLDSSGRGFCHHLRVPVHGIRHEAEIYLDVVRAMGVGTQAVRTEFYPTEQDRVEAEQLLRGQLKWDGVEPLWVLHPAGGRNPGMRMVSKRWPPERYALLATRLLKNFGGKGLILGGPQDRVLLEAVNGLIPYKTVALAGKIEWGVWGAILERATLCIGNDTGASHLAVAAGCKTVFIFGPSDPRRYGPYAQPGQAAALWHPIAGMVNGVNRGPPRDWTWEEGVSADEAWQAAQALLEPEQLARRTDEEE